MALDITVSCCIASMLVHRLCDHAWICLLASHSRHSNRPWASIYSLLTLPVNLELSRKHPEHRLAFNFLLGPHRRYGIKIWNNNRCSRRGARYSVYELFFLYKGNFHKTSTRPKAVPYQNINTSQTKIAHTKSQTSEFPRRSPSAHHFGDHSLHMVVRGKHSTIRITIKDQISRPCSTTHLSASQPRRSLSAKVL